MVSLITTDQGRYIEQNNVRFELPKDSADLYLNHEKYMGIWGDDCFFVTGTTDPQEKPALADFVITGDRDFTLGEKLAYNPKAPKGTDAQEAARSAFKQWLAQDETNTALFPTFVEVRKQENAGYGVKLLSGGAFVFVTHDFGDGPKTKLALLKRTFPPKVLTDGNGLVAEPYTAQKKQRKR